MRLLTTSQYKAAAEADLIGTLSARTAVAKEFITEIKQVGSDEDRTLEFRITTDSVDRHGDTVAAKGWDTAAYARNPVVLFAHDYESLPIGKSIGLSKDKSGLRSTVKFAPAEIHPFAEQIYQLCKGGFLSAASVGFIPKEFESSDRDGYHYPMDITKQELLEWSIVPVPANSDCLMGASTSGINLSVLKGWAEKTLRKVLIPSASKAETQRQAAKGQITWEESRLILRAIDEVLEAHGMPDPDRFKYMTPMQRAWYENNPR